MNVLQVLSITAGAIGIIGVVGGIVGYFAKSRGDSIIEYQAREITLRDGTIARLEKDNAALTAKSNSQAEQIETLKGLAQGSPELRKVSQELARLTTAIYESLRIDNDKRV